MTYDEAKAEVLALVPSENDLYVRVVDQQLLRVRYAQGGIVIVTYGYEESGPADDNVIHQRWRIEKWIAAVTKGTLRRATEVDIRRSQAAVSDTLAGGWRPVRGHSGRI